MIQRQSYGKVLNVKTYNWKKFSCIVNTVYRFFFQYKNCILKENLFNSVINCPKQFLSSTFYLNPFNIVFSNNFRFVRKLVLWPDPWKVAHRVMIRENDSEPTVVTAL